MLLSRLKTNQIATDQLAANFVICRYAASPPKLCGTMNSTLTAIEVAAAESDMLNTTECSSSCTTV